MRTRLLALLLLGFVACRTTGFPTHSTWIHIEQDQTKREWREEGTTHRAEFRGEAQLDESGSQLVGFEEGDGRLVVREYQGENPEAGWVLRLSGGVGDLAREASFAGTPQAWNEQHETILKRALERLRASTSFGAASSARRLMADGGPEAVLEAAVSVPERAAQVYLEAVLDREPREARYLVRSTAASR